jgi:hypothetical protein
MISTRTGQPCGCAPADGSESCALECNEKPRFSRGQLLTDDDLTALVGWSEKKAALARYRRGWGVVCGLEVYCDGHDGQVSLGPGYALDCCGHDIVVCAPATVSLDACCKTTPDPCAAVVTKPTVGAPVDFGPVTAENVRIVDLVLHYAEQGGSPRATLGQTEFSRIAETSRVECTIGPADHDPLQAEVAKWENGYSQCLDVVTRYQNECGKAKGADIQRWLMQWLGRNPPRQFGFLKDWIAEADTEKWVEKLAVQALFWIVQDCRNTFLQSGCSGCESAAGVPIARLWVRLPAAGATKSKCRVLAIDTQRPYRRPILGACWPAPLGQVNAGQVIWRQAEDARAILNGLGIRSSTTPEFTMPQTADDLYKELNLGKLMVATDSTSKLQTFKWGNLGDRVVAIK